jgi:Uma2 family endonuclease
MAVLKDSQELLITGEELYLRPSLEPCELVNGRIVPLSPTGRFHGVAESRFAMRLSIYAESSGKGIVMTGEVGVYIRHDPDTVRAADIAFISNERWARCESPGYLDVAPEIAVEILSPTDRWSDVKVKLQDYFSAGVDRVWVMDSKQRRISAYRSLTDVQQFQVGDILADEELLPGFSLAIADLFG